MTLSQIIASDKMLKPFLSQHLTVRYSDKNTHVQILAPSRMLHNVKTTVFILKILRLVATITTRILDLQKNSSRYVRF